VKTGDATGVSVGHTEPTAAGNNECWQKRSMIDNRDNSSFPSLMTESELVQFLRIPVISNANDHHNVVENLKRLRNLPRIHICNKTLYPKDAIQKWIEQETTTGK
jgi:hypothetical protein